MILLSEVTYSIANICVKINQNIYIILIKLHEYLLLNYFISCESLSLDNNQLNLKIFHHKCQMGRSHWWRITRWPGITETKPWLIPWLSLQKDQYLLQDHPLRCGMCLLSYLQSSLPWFWKKRYSHLDKTPYVCNGCSKKINHCTIAQKNSYNARFADRKYRETLSASRTGISLTRTGTA